MKASLILNNVNMFRWIQQNGRWVPSGHLTIGGRPLWTKQIGEQAVEGFLAKFTPREQKMIKLAARIQDEEALSQLVGLCKRDA